MRRTALLLLAWVLLAGASCHRRVEAPPPTIAEDSPPPPPRSRIDTFVRIPLSALATEADGVVPRTFRVEPYGMLVEGTPDDPIVTAGYEVERGPLSVEATSRGLALRTTLSYGVRARRHVGPIHVSGSCGVDGEARRHFDLAVSVDARVDERWELVPSLAVRALAPTDRCEMTFAAIDVTDKVRSSLVDELATRLPSLRERIRATVALRRRAEEAHRMLAEPIAIGESAYLSLRPERLGIAQPVVEGHFLRVGLSLEARPEVTIGAPPTPATTSLPPATDVVGPPGIDLHVPVRIEHSVVERSLAEAFRLSSGGIRYPAEGRRFVRPTHVSLYGYGTKVVVRVEFEGSADGVLYLVGTPTLDPVAEMLSFPDLDFTLETRSLVLAALGFLRGDELRDELRGRVRVDLRSPLEEARLRLTQALRRRVGPIELEGAIDTLHVVALYADAEARALRALVRATGVVRAEYVGERGPLSATAR